MASGGFNLRKWNSNDSNVSQEISKLENSKGLSLCDNVKVVEDDQTYSKYINGTVKADDQLKVLGVGWDNNKDTLQVDLSGIAAFAKGLPKTKRSVLKIAAKVFDPMGYLAVLTIMFKVFFQQLCVQKCNWDDELDEQKAFAANPTVPQALNTEAQAQTHAQAKNIETPAPHQMSGRAKRNAAIIGELARKYRS